MEHRGQLSPEQDALEHIIACRDKPFLEERFIDSFKGRGVFTHKGIEPSTFVVEYRGKISSRKDKTPKCGDTLNNYLFEFPWIGAQWCIDASKEDGTLGRLVNDDHISPNCEMKKIVYEGKPHLCLFAVTEISPDEEITYNYGDSAYPWRSKESYEGSSASYSRLYDSTSTPRNERLEDSSASSFENSCSDDDDDDDKLPDSGPSCRNDSFADINTQLDFRDSSPFADLDSSQDMTGTFMMQSDDASCIQQEDEAFFSPNDHRWGVNVRPRKPRKNSEDPLYTSKNYCYVCGKGVCKISRHLLKHADEEPEIAEAFAFPHNSKERKRLLNELRNRGNYKHNQEVLKNNSGELKLRRRPKNGEINTKTHAHCLHCKAMFSRNEMWRHVAKCPSRTTSNSSAGGKTYVLTEMALAESPFSRTLPSGVWKLLVTMKPDEITSAVQNDFLLIKLAQSLSDKYGNNPNKRDYIRQKLREMGRLLLALHKKSVFSFEDATEPKNFYKVVEAVKDIAGFNEKKQSYNKPSLALKIGHSLKKICTIVLSGVDGNEQMMRDKKTFMKLCVKEWSALVSHTALASLSGRKVNNPSTIPFTCDVQMFYMYLETTSASAMETLKKYESPQVYNALCRVTLAQASVLSKCASEVSKMTLKTFQERDVSTQVLSKHFIRFNIPSRSGQDVAVLLTSELISAITLLVSKRQACGVHKDNPFLFAKPNSSPTSLYHGGNCVRAFSSLCRAKKPEYLRSVHLHKHIARIFQILNLENDELDHLAKLLGHDIRADRDYYRLPEAAVELAKIAKLLLAMEKGSLERFKGNSLDEIEIEDELEPDVEQGNPEESDNEEDNEESDLLPQQSVAAEQQGSHLTPEQDALQHIKACRDKPFLEDRFINPLKGIGVFTHEAIEPYAFVVELRGNIFSQKETRNKKCGVTLNNYMFDFSWNGTNWRIDASKDDGTLGRLVNDNHESPNCEMKKIVFAGKPHLCLFAVEKISPGEEITYNYGESSYPWRSRESSEGLNTSQTDLNAAASSSENESDEDSAGPSSSAASCCDEDYVPSTSNNSQQCPSFTQSNSSKEQSFQQQPIDASSIQQEDETDYSSGDFTSDEEPRAPSFTNRNYCYVCGKAQSKISRHLYKHKNEEPDIAEVLKLRKNSKERKRLLDKLRDRGNYKHNQEVLKTNCGELKVKRRHLDRLDNAKTFAHCLYCKGMYVREEMCRHMQRCARKKLTQPSPRGKTKVLALVAVAESTDPQNISSEVREMLNALKNDEISSEVQKDSLLLQLAQCLYHTNESKTKKEELVKVRLRQMGRLLLILKKRSIGSFEDAIKPQNFRKVVEAVRELSGFSEETNSSGSPSLMLRLGYLLKKIGDINFARALKEEADKESIREAETFTKLCAKEWKSVPPKAKNLPTVPFIHDVQLFYQCTEKTAASAAKSLTMYESSPVYTALLRVTLAQMSVYNKNMAEVSKATLKSFKERDETELHKDTAVSKSQFEQILSKDTMKINLMSDSGQKVAVTLTTTLLAAVTLLVNKREACGVHENNPFLFARPDAQCTSYFQGHVCAVTFTGRCGAKNKASLRSVFFKMSIVRLFQILSLTNDDLGQLAKLLGPRIQTDREYYQKPEAAVDIAKMLELLSAMENGTFERFEGKSLEEIEIPDELEPDVELADPENSDNEESENSLLSGVSFTKGSSSAKKKRSRGSLSKKTPSQGRSKKRGSGNKPSEQSDERNEKVNTEQGDRSEEIPASCDVNTPEVTVPRKNGDNTNISFSDDDEDMNVDFDIDIDTDDDMVGNKENDQDGDTNGSTPLIPHVKKQVNKQSSVADLDKTMETDAVNHEEREDQKKGGVSFIKGSSSAKKKRSRGSLSKNTPSQGQSKKRESENKPSELSDERNEKVNTEQGDSSEEIPASCDVNTPEVTVPRKNGDNTNISFSDDDEDMNVDFDIDIDTDDDMVGNKENDQDGDTNGSTPLIPHVKKQANKQSSVADLDETMETDAVNHEEREDQKKGEKKNKSSAPMPRMKEVKILIPKLDIDKFRRSVHISQLPSECNSVTSVKDQPITTNSNQHVKSSSSTNVKDKPNNAKETLMNCSNCKLNMMKGQTAYQKKGFTDVFCSKNCLFKMFPVNKPVNKTCHYCLKTISQPLDLIMAAVDVKGTMKDFCSPTCLLSFKSNTVPTQTPQQLCSMCNKSCTTTCEFALNEAVLKFCSNSCLEDLRKNTAVCDSCSSTCLKPLKLKLKEGTKSICNQKCLDEFKEKTKTSHQCTLCKALRPVSEMSDYTTDDKVVELFCNRYCVTSYKLCPVTGNRPQEEKSSDGLKKWRRSKQSKQGLNFEEVEFSADSTVNKNDASAAAVSDTTATLVIASSKLSKTCCTCEKSVPRGGTVYKLKSSQEVFCSTVCLFERQPHIKLGTKTCYNCFQMIMRPHNMILAPVDDSGTMKELCSNTCLASVNSKRTVVPPKPPPPAVPQKECRMCSKFCDCKFQLTLDGELHSICSEACFINYHRINNLPVSVCDVCGCVSHDEQFMVGTKDDSQIICSEECLVMFKEKTETPQLCPMCQTSHQLSDMVENKNDEGRLDFFCSSRCLMVHKAQSSTVSGKNSPTPDASSVEEINIKEVKPLLEENDIKEVKPLLEENNIKEVKPLLEENDIKEVKPLLEENDIKEVKPSLPYLDCIKEEPIDEEYNQNLPSSISTDDIKDEPKAGDVTKVDLQIGSVFSLTEDSSTTTTPAPTLTHMDLPASCSNCKQVLIDGETVYQRKGHADIFCSSSCLLKFYQMKQVKKTCHFCLQGIAQRQDILQAPVDNDGTKKDFCSQTCLSSFNYKKIMSTKIPLVPLASHSQCSMCSRYCISKHEIIRHDVVHKICSDTCFLRFCNINNLSICENCHSSCSKPLMLSTEDGNKKLCDAECLAQFKQKIKTQQPCSMCQSSHLMSDMFENKNSEDIVELFCTYSCVMASKIQAVSASGIPLNCDHCGKTTLPACHLAMSDFSVKNFCTLTCAMSFKESQKDLTANSTGAADQTQIDYHKPPEKLPCAQCRRIIKATPKVIQKKGKMNFVCNLACSQEFKRVNNIMGKCEYCKNERIITNVKKVDSKDCYFCSDGCLRLFQHELEKKWGEHCGSCAYCFSISKTLVTAKYEGIDEEFCSEECSSNYNMLLCRVANCDTCGRNGKLRQSLPMIGEVKHFCDLRCLLHFCNRRVQMVNKVSSPPRSTGTVESSPVIANVISLAGALARQSSASSSSAQTVSVPDIQTKVVGHASIQTVPTELKNKSMLCTPLVHNKGVSCTIRTVDSAIQTDNVGPNVVPLPVPVPVYVPLPMNMYSQYTPKPMGLPLPLPVPIFLPDPMRKNMKEKIQPDLLEGELNLKSERKKVQDERNERKDRVVTEEALDRQETHSPKDHTSNCRDDLNSDHQATLHNKEDSSSDSSCGSLSRPHIHEKPPQVLEVGMISEPQPELQLPAPPPPPEMREDPQSSPSPELAPPLSQQSVGKVHNKNKGRKMQQLSKAAKQETSQRDSSKVISKKHHKLKSQCGIDAWKRWIQWRESQTNLDLVSSHAVTLKEDVLCCSSAELSSSLCYFITEVKRHDGEPYSPDSLFYLCLGIQQYLFDNGRMENIFSDMIYAKFSKKFTKILKGFKPKIIASGNIHSCVEEEYLWDCKQLGAYSPIVLLNTLLFFCCKYLGFTTVEQLRQLSFTHIKHCTRTDQNDTETNFLRFCPPTSINKAESDADGVPAKKRKKTESKEGVIKMMENTENPLRCPVRLYEFYLSKCSESVRQRTDLFYLRPDRSCVPSSSLWFSSTPLDDSTMEAMLVRILAVRKLRGGDGGSADQQTPSDTPFIPDEEDSEG
ncbi:uncharacterized protein LOC126384039 isoform X1 [Epinephelus moara]|uniref:uncharacterized protein LOC126384039 isoform X1 n=1 Tax=Epinephelus moara TaxID=300413 RepID=UPI00214E91CD|nr:uncharacterized protein LOC126384039 isoform X1 [Epinephelus moara]